MLQNVRNITGSKGRGSASVFAKPPRLGYWCRVMQSETFIMCRSFHFRDINLSGESVRRVLHRQDVSMQVGGGVSGFVWGRGGGGIP